MQVLSYFTRCIQPRCSIVSTGYTKTKHQVSTSNLCGGKVSCYTLLSSVRWFTTITRLGTSYWQGNNFQNNQRNKQCNMGSFERFIWSHLKKQQIGKPYPKNFGNLWNFPHCIGAIDGKHFAIEYRKLSGTQIVWFYSQFVMQNIV